MPCTLVLGLSVGDEGKGRIVDYLAPQHDIVVRFNGSSNAGHTIVVGNNKYVTRIMPSGILNKNTTCVISQGVMIDPTVLLKEILEFSSFDTNNRLLISEDAFIILPIHKMIDAIREEKSSNKIGTTKNGVGPAFEDKVGRRGLRVYDLHDMQKAKNIVCDIMNYWSKEHNPTNYLQILKETYEMLENFYKATKHLYTNTAIYLNKAYNQNKNILLEGAQATLLDVDHGTYPYVTSSNCVAAAASINTGLAPNKISKVIGVFKAYNTRVGNGPFPTEISGEAAKYIRDKGQEYGAVTGRPRRVGWLDIPLLNYASMINGCTELIMTKYDIISDMQEIKICVGYEKFHSVIYDVVTPSMLENNKPIYETFSPKRFNIKEYVKRLHIYTMTPISMVSLGAERDEIKSIHHLG